MLHSFKSFQLFFWPPIFGPIFSFLYKCGVFWRNYISTFVIRTKYNNTIKWRVYENIKLKSFILQQLSAMLYWISQNTAQRPPYKKNNIFFMSAYKDTLTYRLDYFRNKLKTKKKLKQTLNEKKTINNNRGLFFEK